MKKVYINPDTQVIHLFQFFKWNNHRINPSLSIFINSV